MSRFLRHHLHLIIFFILLALLFSVEWITFMSLINSRIGAITIFRLAMDCILLFGPLFILPRRWTWIFIILLWIISAYLAVCAIYYRFFGDIIPLGMLSYSDNVGGVLLQSVLGVLRPSDLVYLICPLLATVAYIFPLAKAISREAPLSPKTRCLSLGFLILTLVGGQFICLYSYYRYLRSGGLDNGLAWCARLTYLTYPHPTSSQSVMLLTKGLAVSLPLHTWHELRLGRTINLHADRRREIKQFLADEPPLDPELAEAFIPNRDKNLLLIIVESLNSSAVTAREGDNLVMPNLCSLIDAEGTISCLDVVCQAGAGVSSDGQFIYNTGLLPLRGTAVVMVLPDNTYFPLARRLAKKESVEIIMSDPNLWNHRINTLAFGYDRFLSNRDVPRRDNEGEDEALFRFAAQTIASAPKPCFVEIATVSSHPPFQYEYYDCPQWLRDSSRNETDKAYLSAIHYVDACLGDFIATLKERGLYDNSVIVIVSDHDLRLEQMRSGPSNGFIPFIALNTGVTRQIDRTVGQIDIYPTILQIMGVDTSSDILGHSILDPDHNCAIDIDGSLHGASSDTLRIDRARRAWDVSEQIIRGNYYHR